MPRVFRPTCSVGPNAGRDHCTMRKVSDDEWTQRPQSSVREQHQMEKDARPSQSLHGDYGLKQHYCQEQDDRQHLDYRIFPVDSDVRTEYHPSDRPQDKLFEEYKDFRPEEVRSSIEERVKDAVDEVLQRFYPNGVSVQLLLARTKKAHQKVVQAFPELDSFYGRKVSRPDTLRRLGYKVVAYPVSKGHGEHHYVYPRHHHEVPWNDTRSTTTKVEEILASIERDIQRIAPDTGIFLTTLLRTCPTLGNHSLIENFARLDCLAGVRISASTTLTKLGFPMVTHRDSSGTLQDIVFPRGLDWD